MFLCVLGKQSFADCVPCDPGFYCQTSGLSNVTGECFAGYYCVEGSDSPTPTNDTGFICPIGNYCPQGSHAPIPCPNATYMNHTGAEECYECPEGYYCTNRDRADICPQGFYCPQGTGIGFIPCPEGTFGASEGLASEGQCSQCTGGQFCDRAGLTEPAGPCAPGHYCTSGVNITNPEVGVAFTGDGGRCFAGYECPENSTFPTPCGPGFYAPLEGMAACEVCEEGYYCINVTVNPEICPSGHICPAGTEFAEQYPCEEGTYNNDSITSLVSE